MKAAKYQLFLGSGDADMKDVEGEKKDEEKQKKKSGSDPFGDS